ncbi:CopD family protein [Oryzicola mucosus]|uniref:CopD family protein n=1 Tax=Oryzicola mucosus TaxID=2767425 RepID=UPI002ED933AF
MIVILLKFVHILSIAIWSAGLLCLPFLYVQRRRLEDDALHRLHNFTRFIYVGVISPAAFMAVACGIALIFLQATYQPWFSVKLALVGIMVMIHVMSGLMILRLFEPGQTYPYWRFVAVTVLTTSVIGAILFVVLGKPVWSIDRHIAGIFAPGALGVMLGELIAWLR